MKRWNPSAGKLLTISNGNIKVNAPNISLLPIRDCGKESRHCAATCYARKAVRSRSSVRIAWDCNGKVFRQRLPEAGRELANFFWQNRPPYFRIHVAGDFLSQQHINLWRTIAESFPSTRFLAFTKRFDLSFSHLPKNFKIFYSMWPSIPDKTPADMLRAWMQDGSEDRVPRNAFVCPGNCKTCQHTCWHTDHDVVFHLH
jgi:hypothetical protein